MTNTKAKYFWAEPDGGADLRLSLPLDCFWEAPGYDSGITVRLSQEGASVRRLTTVRFPEFEARFRRAFCPRSPTSSSAATASRRNCGTPSAAACAHSWRGRRRSRPLTGAATPASWVCTISVSANFIASILGPPPRPIRGLPDIYKFYQIDGFQPFQAAFFRGSGDFYFVDPDFEWAYIVTHEPELGPYFVTKAT